VLKVISVHVVLYAYIDPPQILPVLLTAPEPGQVVVRIGIHTKFTVSTGATVLVYCNATGIDIPTIEWFKDGMPVNSGRNITVRTTSSHLYIAEVLTFNNFQPRDAGLYKCQAANTAGIDSRNVTLQSKSFNLLHTN